MIKLLFAFLISVFCSSLYATSYKVIDNKITFVPFTIDGNEAWDNNQKNTLISKLTRVESGTITAHIPVAVNITPTSDEVNLSTCPIQSKNLDEAFNVMKSDKKVLKKKRAELKSERDKYDDDKTSDEYIDLNSRYLWLKNYIQDLP